MVVPSGLKEAKFLANVSVFMLIHTQMVAAVRILFIIACTVGVGCFAYSGVGGWGGTLLKYLAPYNVHLGL